MKIVDPNFWAGTVDCFGIDMLLYALLEQFHLGLFVVSTVDQFRCVAITRRKK